MIKKSNQPTPHQPSMLDQLTDKAQTWIGSTASLVIHTVLFIVIFGLAWFGVAFDTILLILTTAVSLEAIYLAIFIQRAVNMQSESIAGEFDQLEEAISEDIDETEAALMKDLDETERNISKDLDETERNISKDLDETEQNIFKDLDDTEAEISKDIDETERGIVKQTPKALEQPLDEVLAELRSIVREEINNALKEKR